MRDRIARTVAAMEPPSAEARAEAALHGGSQSANDRYQAEWPCLNTIEVVEPPVALPEPRTLTVAAWNLERCKRVEDSAEVLRAAGADVVLATEMDWGMARSGQRHTTRDLARALGMGHIYGVEFVELGIGDPYETSLFQGVPNGHGLHGNAILSRYGFEDVSLIPLDDGGAWFVGSPKGDGQFRVGGRMALAARIAGVTFVCAHYESEGDAEGRAAQTRRLLEALPTGPAVLGGDLNTRGFGDASLSGAETLARPASEEPAFACFAEAGFDWRTANTGQRTTRAAPGKRVHYPLQILDWLLTRDVPVSAPRVVPAVSATGDYLSDHECILATITLGQG